MASNMKDLGIDRLSLDERLDLMHEIWESVSEEAGHGILISARPAQIDDARRGVTVERASCGRSSSRRSRDRRRESR